ncbi:hypothetical protein K1719_019937 [Acacia pycnantha]|nr:hypothetical protein K1719_035824 [Acacia pycnantha]KAI9108982.1 hypothetical protein K1719_019937 [Acacia pycnantha]
MASDDRSYNCVQQQEDEQQQIGFAITKDLMNVAGQVLLWGLGTRLRVQCGMSWLIVKPKEESRSGNWHLAFGSGFKRNSAVWVALDNIETASLKNAWTDYIREFPVNSA